MATKLEEVSETVNSRRQRLWHQRLDLIYREKTTRHSVKDALWMIPLARGIIDIQRNKTSVHPW